MAGARAAATTAQVEQRRQRQQQRRQPEWHDHYQRAGGVAKREPESGEAGAIRFYGDAGCDIVVLALNLPRRDAAVVLPIRHAGKGEDFRTVVHDSAAKAVDAYAAAGVQAIESVA